MFSTAKSISAPKTAAKKVAKEQHELEGLEALTKLNALITAAEAMKKTMEADIKATGFSIFMESKGSTRPSSFEGVEGVATCSVEMRKRGTNSALTEDEAKVLREANIEPFKQIVTQKLFAINPKYAEDASLLSKVEKALTKLGVPEDLIVQQEEVSKLVVSDEMLDNAFKASGSEAVLQIMTTMALKPKLSEAYDMANLLTDAMEIMSPKKKASKLPVAKKVA